jgi:hypothetical protein
VPLQTEGGVFKVPVTINNTIILVFTLDSGASDVSIPRDVVSTLMRTGTLTAADFQEEATYRFNRTLSDLPHQISESRRQGLRERDWESRVRRAACCWAKAFSAGSSRGQSTIVGGSWFWSKWRPQESEGAHEADGATALTGRKVGLCQGPYSRCLHFFISLLELLFGLFQRLGKTVVRRRGRKQRCVHGPNPPWRCRVLVNPTDRPFIVEDDIVVLRILPAQCVFSWLSGSGSFGGSFRHCWPILQLQAPLKQAGRPEGRLLIATESPHSP